MNTQKRIFLLPHRCQFIGWIIAGVSLLVMITSVLLGLESIQLVHFQLYGFLFLYLGLFLVGFSREKTEDEFTLHLRTSSALTAMLVIFALNFLLWLVISMLLVTGVIGREGYDFVMKLVNENTGFGTVFILYLILYKVRLARYNKEVEHEE